MIDIKLSLLHLTLLLRLIEINPDEEELNNIFYILLEEYEGLKKVDFAINNHIISKDPDRWLDAIDELVNGKPIDYVIGKKWFYNDVFKVNEHTLIPRPETEELVDWVIKTINDNSNKVTKVLDIGTGTGCIPISIKKKCPDITLFSMDVSEEALKVAEVNANDKDVNITFIHHDILKPFSGSLTVDIIVSNPPYVRMSEKTQMHKNVLDFEPHTALFVSDENPLIFYKAIIDFAKIHLNSNGWLFFEINQYLATETKSLMEQNGFTDIELKKDFIGNDRMLMGRLIIS